MADNIKGITVEINGDTQKLSKALTDINKDIRTTQNDLKEVDKLLKLDPKNTELITQKHKLLAKEIENTKDKLEALKQAEAEAKQMLANGDIGQEEFDKLQRQIIATEQQLKQFEGEMEKLPKSGGNNLKELGSQFEDVGKKIGEVGDKLMPLSATVAAAMTGIGAAAYASAKELDEGYDTIITKTGATGDALEDLQEVADGLFSSLPVEMEDVGTAVGEVNTRFGLVGDELDSLSKKFIQFANINSVDLNNSIGNTHKVMQIFNVDTENAGDLLGMLTKRAQETGISTDTLLTSLQTSGSTFKELGLSIEESVNLVAKLEQNGVNASTALAGLKKGISTLAKSGKDPKKAMQELFGAIKNAKTETEAMSKAAEIFGTRGAAEMTVAIRDGRLSVEDLTDSMEEYGDVVEKTFEATLDPWDDLKVAMNGVKTDLSKTGAEFAKSLIPMIKEAADKLKDLIQWWNKLSPEMQKVIVTCGLVVAAIGPVTKAIGGLVTGIGQIVSAIGTIGTLASGPIGIALIALAAFAAAFVAVKAGVEENRQEFEAYIQATYGLTESQEAAIAKTHEVAEAWTALKEARDSSFEDIDYQTQKEQALWAELDHITKSNGEIMEGMEDRAAYIVGELSSALGTEITITDGVIENYRTLKDSIDRVIQSKQLEAYLMANEDAYAEAVKNHTNAVLDKKDASEMLAAEEQKLKDMETELEAVQFAHDVQLQRTGGNIEDVGERVGELKKREKELTEGIITQNETIQALQTRYDEASATVENYSRVIQDQEALVAAQVSGSSKDIEDACIKVKNAFVTAETGTKESLTKQVTDAREKYNTLKQLSLTEPGVVTKNELDEAGRLVQLSKIELRKYNQNYKETYADNLKDAQQSSTDMEAEAKTGGEKFTTANAQALSDGKPKIKTEMEGIKTDCFNPYVSESRQWGYDMGSNMAQGIRDSIDEIRAAAEAAAEAAAGPLEHTVPKEGPLKNELEWMPHMMQNLAKGIRDNSYLVTDEMRNLAANMNLSMQPTTTANLTMTTPIYLDGRQIATVVNNRLGVML